jgi:hypothetical protein
MKNYIWIQPRMTVYRFLKILKLESENKVFKVSLFKKSTKIPIYRESGSNI